VSRTRYIHIQTFDIRTANVFNNSCSHGFSGQESLYVTCVRLPSTHDFELKLTQRYIILRRHGQVTIRDH